MGKKIIHDTSEMRGFYPGLKKGVDRAVVAAAFKIRDTARTTFNSSRSLYKHSTKKYKHLSEGINVGKFDETSETIKVHALGSKEDKDTYKTRFFVGGTVYRKQKRWQGKRIKPYLKGYIEPNDALNDATGKAEEVLNRYVRNVLKK